MILPEHFLMLESFILFFDNTCFWKDHFAKIDIVCIDAGNKVNFWVEDYALGKSYLRNLVSSLLAPYWKYKHSWSLG